MADCKTPYRPDFPAWLPAADMLADASVVASFSRLGYDLRKPYWNDADLDVDLKRRVCLITGANSGIGRETARAWAERNGTVILACRNEERGTEAQQALQEETGNKHVHLELVDLAELDSVKACAKRVLKKYKKLHVLCCNAGTMLHERQTTSDGIEANLATNVLGHFVLTNLLLPRMVKSAPARLLHTSSGGMYTQRLNVDDLQMEQGTFDGVRAYAQNKRAQVILSEMYAEKLQGTGVTSNCFHPGWADTPAVRAYLPKFHQVMGPILRTPAQGADTLIWLAIAPHLADVTGEFWLDRRPVSPHIWALLTESNAWDRQKLWEELVRLGGEGLTLASRG